DIQSQISWVQHALATILGQIGAAGYLQGELTQILLGGRGHDVLLGYCVRTCIHIEQLDITQRDIGLAGTKRLMIRGSELNVRKICLRQSPPRREIVVAYRDGIVMPREVELVVHA